MYEINICITPALSQPITNGAHPSLEIENRYPTISEKYSTRVVKNMKTCETSIGKRVSVEIYTPLTYPYISFMHKAVNNER